MIKTLIQQLLEQKNLTAQEMQVVMQEILSGVTPTADIVAFLSALSSKGETVGEITAAVKMMLKYVEPIIAEKDNILDTCGTGGDKLGSFNISTISALVASGAGVTVAKHGNRAVSSKCGSADILEALGVNINLDRQKLKNCLEEVGIAFLFTPNLNLAMKNVMAARKQIAQKTIFNILGPLINPARATNQLVGVYSRDWVRPLAEVLYNLGSEHVLVVCGADGLDEVSTTCQSFISEVIDGKIKDYQILPEDFGLARAKISDLLGGSIQENVRIAQEVLSGKKGKRRDIVLFNSGCAIYAANKAKSISQGISLAQASLDSGAALKKLELLKEFTTKYGQS